MQLGDGLRVLSAVNFSLETGQPSLVTLAVVVFMRLDALKVAEDRFITDLRNALEDLMKSPDLEKEDEWEDLRNLNNSQLLAKLGVGEMNLSEVENPRLDPGASLLVFLKQEEAGKLELRNSPERKLNKPALLDEIKRFKPYKARIDRPRDLRSNFLRVMMSEIAKINDTPSISDRAKHFLDRLLYSAVYSSEKHR
jgi:hypothetical protein